MYQIPQATLSLASFWTCGRSRPNEIIEVGNYLSSEGVFFSHTKTDDDQVKVGVLDWSISRSIFSVTCKSAMIYGCEGWFFFFFFADAR